MFKKIKKVYVVTYHEYGRYQEDGFPYTIVVGVFNKFCDASAYVSTKAGSVAPTLVEYPNEDGIDVTKSAWGTKTHDCEYVSYFYLIEEFDLK